MELIYWITVVLLSFYLLYHFVFRFNETKELFVKECNGIISVEYAMYTFLGLYVIVSVIPIVNTGILLRIIYKKISRKLK